MLSLQVNSFSIAQFKLRFNRAATIFQLILFKLQFYIFNYFLSDALFEPAEYGDYFIYVHNILLYASNRKQNRIKWMIQGRSSTTKFCKISRRNADRGIRKSIKSSGAEIDLLSRNRQNGYNFPFCCLIFLKYGNVNIVLLTLLGELVSNILHFVAKNLIQKYAVINYDFLFRKQTFNILMLMQKSFWIFILKSFNVTIIALKLR